MATIINKKGNIGFRVLPWNFHRTMNGGAIFDFIRRGKLVNETVQIAVQHVQVHSCGKKVMRLAELQADGTFVAMKGREFDPATELHATQTGATAAAHELFDTVAPSAADYADRMAAKYDAGDYGNYDTTAATAALYRELAARIRDGRCPLEIVYK